MPANDLIIFRKGSGAQWTSSNPILASGEPGYDVTNNILKIGDGVSNWQSLNSHKHNISDINSFASGVADVINTEMVGGSGISLIYNSQNNTVTISVTGIVSGGEGNTGPIMVSDITDFNSGVSGLIENIYAPLSGPVFTGVPIVPTANSGSNDNQIANTKFVRNEIASVINSAPEALDTLYELASALGSDSNFSTTVTNSLSNKASLSGAIFTGAVTIPSGSINATTLSVTGVPVSVSGHSHSISDISDFDTSVDAKFDTNVIGGSGILLSFDSNTQTLSINASNTGLSLSSTDSLPEGSSNLYFTNSRASGASPVQSVAGKTGVITLSGSDVGLGNVNNTSDANKPISLAVQSGLDLKASTSHYHIISDISGLELSLSGKQPSGNYAILDSSANFSSLSVNNTGVSLSGHSHSYSDITDFNTGVSGLLTDYAQLNSPALTGTPIVPTAPTGTNSNQIASTEFVRNEIANLVASAPSTLDTLNEIALSLNNDASFSSTIVSGLASKASLSGASFSGSVVIPSGSINANILTVDNIPVSVSGHTHIVSNISGLDTAIENKFDTSIAAGSGIAFTYDSGTSILTISTSGGSFGGSGAQGTMGIQGIQGLEGIQGTIGTQGIQGLEGIQGTIGTQGIQGLEGIQGTIGTQGIQGLEGIQGTIGTQGIQGTVGTQGIQGTSGTIDQLYSIGNSSTTKMLSLDVGNVQTVSLNGNCVFTMPSASAAANLTIIINQTGSFTATFTGVKWGGGVVPTITTGSGKIDIISFISDGTNWYGGIVQNLL